MEEKLTPKIFLNKVLAGTATGIIVGLIPNAVLAAILKLFGENTLAVTITQMAVIFQLATPLLIGALIAVQFGFKPMQMLVVAGAAFVGSGVVKFNPDTATYIGAGTGDIINTMITASIAVGMILLIGEKFGSVAIVATPIVVGIGAGLIGYYLYPYVTKITAAIGDLINTFYYFATNFDVNLDCMFLCFLDYLADLYSCHWYGNSIEQCFCWCSRYGCCRNNSCLGS